MSDFVGFHASDIQMVAWPVRRSQEPSKNVGSAGTDFPRAGFSTVLTREKPRCLARFPPPRKARRRGFLVKPGQRPGRVLRFGNPRLDALQAMQRRDEARWAAGAGFPVERRDRFRVDPIGLVGDLTVRAA
jgi:hypothetical protein